MSITDELREWMKGSTLSSWTAEHLTAIADHIDAAFRELLEENERFIIKLNAEHIVRQNVETENAKLRERMAEPSGGARSIGSATVTVTPTLDWTGVARELRSIADALGSCNCTNSERTNETCHDLGGTGANDGVVDE